jgi:D-sedoheptulose 7-phosphate isomerase
MEASFSDAVALTKEFLESKETERTFSLIVAAFVKALESGHRVLVCGNGGSLSDAMHFAEEWTGRFREERKPLPVLALSDPAHITCVGNDFGFEYIFSRMVEAWGSEGDILVVLTTSGRSPNIIEAARVGREKKMTVIGLLGKGGGEVKSLCDIALVAPGKTTDRIQELHMIILHTLTEVVERNVVKK